MNFKSASMYPPLYEGKINIILLMLYECVRIQIFEQFKNMRETSKKDQICNYEDKLIVTTASMS